MYMYIPNLTNASHIHTSHVSSEKNWPVLVSQSTRWVHIWMHSAGVRAGKEVQSLVDPALDPDVNTALPAIEGHP